MKIAIYFDMLKKILITGLLFSSYIASSQATTVGFFSVTTNNNFFINVGQIVSDAGLDFEQLADLNADSLANIDVLWIANRNNLNPIPDINTNYTAISNFVQAGGVLLFQSRLVTDSSSLPGASGISFVRDLNNNGTDVNVLNNTTTVTNGPAGFIDDTTLDGGNKSSHGYALLGSLPDNSLSIFSRPDATEIVDFTYQYGNGDVYISTIPSDYYIGGTATPDAFKGIYAPNLVTYAAELSVANVPVPSAVWFLGTGLLGLLGLNKKKIA
ncbi:MAG: hypothetical protein PHH11_00095 [Methylomonas sp.]|nr:hypothetical protein [Methylomonas sp.]